MDIVECPHCYTRVMPSSSGICPACQKNINERPALPDMTQELIDTRWRPPAICMICGEPAEEHVDVIFTRVSPTQGERIALGGAFGAVLLLVRALLWLIGRTLKQRVAFSAPVCCAHRSSQLLKPVEIDWSNGYFTFIVHRIFRDKWRITVAQQSLPTGQPTAGS